MLGISFKGRLSKSRFIVLSTLTLCEFFIYLLIIWFVATQLFHQKPIATGRWFSQYLITTDLSQTTPQAIELIQKQDTAALQNLLTTMIAKDSYVPESSGVVNQQETQTVDTSRHTPNTTASKSLFSYLTNASLLTVDPRVSEGTLALLMSYLVSAYYLLKSLSQAARRAHDLNLSALCNVLLFIPWVSLLWLFILGVCKGLDVDNVYNKGTFKQNLQKALLKQQADKIKSS